MKNIKLKTLKTYSIYLVEEDYRDETTLQEIKSGFETEEQALEYISAIDSFKSFTILPIYKNYL